MSFLTMLGYAMETKVERFIPGLEGDALAALEKRLNEIEDRHPQIQTGVDDQGFWAVLIHRELVEEEK